MWDAKIKTSLTGCNSEVPVVQKKFGDVAFVKLYVIFLIKIILCHQPLQQRDICRKDTIPDYIGIKHIHTHHLASANVSILLDNSYVVSNSSSLNCKQ